MDNFFPSRKAWSVQDFWSRRGFWSREVPDAVGAHLHQDLKAIWYLKKRPSCSNHGRPYSIIRFRLVLPNRRSGAPKLPTHFGRLRFLSEEPRRSPRVSPANRRLWKFINFKKKKMIHKSKVNSPRILIDIDRLRTAKRRSFRRFVIYFAEHNIYKNQTKI